MVRNWDIIREILLRLEASQTANTTLNAHDIAGHDEQEVSYNMRLLKENGYIVAMIRESTAGDGRILNAIATRLNSSGHDLLDSIRSDTIWGRVKDHFKSKGVEMSFDFVIAVSKTITERMLSA